MARALRNGLKVPPAAFSIQGTIPSAQARTAVSIETGTQAPARAGHLVWVSVRNGIVGGADLPPPRQWYGSSPRVTLADLSL